MPTTMQLWETSAPGQDNLASKEVSVPVPGRGQLSVKVRAIAIDYRDLDVIETGVGGALPVPFTPGSDPAGRSRPRARASRASRRVNA